MENEILKLCGIAVLCAVVGILVGNVAGMGLSSALKISGVLLIFGGGAVMLAGAVEQIRLLGDFSGAEEYASIMIRALGISFLCRICSDICRDCGQSSVASAVESVGKLCLVVIALPLVGELAQYAGELLERL